MPDALGAGSLDQASRQRDTESFTLYPILDYGSVLGPVSIGFPIVTHYAHDLFFVFGI